MVKIISNALYNKIPLFDKLESMSMSKLTKYAWNNYGVVYNPAPGANKSDIIFDILRYDKDVIKLKSR